MTTLPGKSMFLENTKTRFRLSVDADETMDLDLIEIKEGLSTPRMEQFSLLFRGPAAFVLPQKIYSLQQDRLGTFDLFLVPISKDEQGTYYEAVFNCLISA